MIDGDGYVDLSLILPVILDEEDLEELLTAHLQIKNV